MKKFDKSALPFIAFGILLLFEGKDLDIGSFNRPGAALFPVLLIAILILFSIISFFISNEEGVPKDARKLIPLKVLYGLGILIGFRLIIPLGGYFITTLLMLMALLKILGGQKWFATIIWSLIVTTASFFLFVKWFGVPFPKGILPF